MNSDTLALSPPAAALQHAIAQLYAVFGNHPAPRHLLDVCTNCCMDAELEKEMRSLPLRQLTARHFYQYNDSAKSAVQPAAEMQYLLPRLLELLAQGAHLHHSIEIILQRLGNCSASAFTDKERAAIDAYALAFFADGLSQPPPAQSGRFMCADAFDILLMFDIGGIALEPLLAYWLQDDSPSATLHYACAVYWNCWNCGSFNVTIINPFAEQRQAFQQTLANWLQEPRHRDHFTNNILNLIDTMPALVGVTPMWNDKTPIEILAAVFDLLSDGQ